RHPPRSPPYNPLPAGLGNPLGTRRGGRPLAPLSPAFLRRSPGNGDGLVGPWRLFLALGLLLPPGQGRQARRFRQRPRRSPPPRERRPGHAASPRDATLPPQGRGRPAPQPSRQSRGPLRSHGRPTRLEPDGNPRPPPSEFRGVVSRRRGLFGWGSRGRPRLNFTLVPAGKRPQSPLRWVSSASQTETRVIAAMPAK